MKIVFTLLLMVCATAQAQAQSVWRCGPDGRSYSSTPCVDGRPVAVADEARPASDAMLAGAMDKALAIVHAQPPRPKPPRREPADRKSTRLNSSHGGLSRMPSSA